MKIEEWNKTGAERYCRIEEDQTVTPLTVEEFAALSQDEGRLFIIIGVHRIGGQLFATELETGYFPPETEANKEFKFYIANWQDLAWGVIDIPMWARNYADIVAEKTNMKIVDGILIVLPGPVSFPLSGDNVFTLSNVSDSPVYDNGPGAEAMKKVEKKCVEDAWKKFDQEQARRN